MNDLGKRLVDMRARVEQTIYLVFQKIRATFIFMITSAIVDQFSYFSLLNSEMICGKKNELKLPPPLKSVAAVPCETKGVNYTTLHTY